MESKFISKETLAYLEAQAGSGHTQRIVALETNMENTVVFLRDYEAYIDSQIQDIQQRADLQKEEMYEIEKRAFSQLGLLQADALRAINNVENGLRRVAILSLSIALLTVVSGVALWLVK